MTMIELRETHNHQTIVTIRGVSGIILYYSYETIIAFRTSQTGLIVRQNEWSTTTGTLLNQLDGGNKKDRVDSKTFEELLDAALSQSMKGAK